MYEKQMDLVNQVVSDMRVCADMLGPVDELRAKEYGFAPGLNELELAHSLEKKIDSIEQGIFQVMFTGCFNAGKSTLLNALMRREVLRMSPKPETAVITKVIFNAENDHVVVFRKDKIDANGMPMAEKMDLQEFFEKYRVDQEDKDKFMREVDHADIYLAMEGIAGGMVQLVDSPGTRASNADTIVAHKFASSADAIVFLISAVVPLEQEDKEYIAEHFANRHMRNVFFAVNRVNQVNQPSEIEDLKQYVKRELREVFLNENGAFDAELYDSRVFFLDAFGSLNTRLGRETPISAYFKTMIQDELTGVQEFEGALARFLTTGDRDKVALQAYLPQLARHYKVARDSAERKLALLNSGLEDARRRKIAFEQDREQINNEIRDIVNDIDNAQKRLIADAGEVYDDFLNAIETEWDDYFSDKSGAMGVKYMKMLSAQTGKVLAFWKDKQIREETFARQAEEAIAPFAEGIKRFMELQNTKMTAEFESRLKENIDALAENLNRHQSRLESFDIPMDIDTVIEAICKDQPVSFPDQKHPNLAQAFMAILFSDPELVVTAAGGDKGMLAFIVDIIKTNVIDVVLMMVISAILGNIIGIVVFVAIKLFKSANRGDDMTKKLIAETKRTLLEGSEGKDDKRMPGLRGEGKAAFVSRTKNLIGGAMLRTGTKMTESIQESMNAVERELQSVVTMLEQDGKAYDAERQRVGQVLEKMIAMISDISRLTSDRPLTSEEIVALATESK